MRRLSTQTANARSLQRGENRPTVCVVDPRPDDYEMWRATAESRGLQLTFFASAEEALRLAPTSAVALWVVNTALPGLSGFDLCGMLRSQSARVPVFLIAEEYSIEAEQAAWRARASMFGCRSQHVHWLDAWSTARGLAPPDCTVQPSSVGRKFC